MSSEREIPEEVFRKEFGGEAIEATRQERMRGRQRELALGGLVLMLVGPAIAIAIGVWLVRSYYCGLFAAC